MTAPTREQVEALPFFPVMLNAIDPAIDVVKRSDVLALYDATPQSVPEAGEPVVDTKNGVPPIKLGPWRRVMALRHGCNPSALYGDDGELQCKECGVDFARMEPDEIENHWWQQQLASIYRSATPPAAAPEPTEAMVDAVVNALAHRGAHHSERETARLIVQAVLHTAALSAGRGNQ